MMNPEAKILLDQAEKLEAQAAQIEAEAAARAGDLRSGKVKTVPMDALPPEIRESLKRAWDKLPEEVKQKIREQARKQLEELEDEMNKDLRGKLIPDAPPDHGQIIILEQKAADDAAKKIKISADKAASDLENERVREEIKRKLEQNMSEYDKAYADVKHMIDQLADELRKIFQPSRHPRWRSGFPTGERMNLQKALQFEADPAKYNELMDRKTVPDKHDFRFTLLVDISGSMLEDGKIDKMFRGAILLAEALENVGIKVEILGFWSEVIKYKDFDEPLSKLVRDRMSNMVDCHGGTDDGYAVKTAADSLLQQEGREKFLVVITDGESAPTKHRGPQWDLRTIVNQLKEQRSVKLVGVGIGSGTEFVRNVYPNSAVMEDVSELPQNLAGLFEDMVRNPNSY